jgi:3-methyladenine DNA glycosylase AlkD
VQPEETAQLVAPNISSRVYAAKNWALRQVAKPYVAWKMRPAVA